MTSGPSPIEPESIFAGLQWSPIFRGAILDTVLTVLTTIPLVVVFAGEEVLSPDSEVSERAIEQALATPGFLAWSMIVGLLITVYAGLWASQRAGTAHLRHGGWTAVVSLVMAVGIMLVTGSAPGSDTPLWYDCLGIASTVPAGVFGGWLAMTIAKRAA